MRFNIGILFLVTYLATLAGIVIYVTYLSNMAMVP